MNLDRITEISRMDTEDMLELLLSFPKQCEEALYIGENVKPRASYKRNYSQIIFTGLGGSAIGADIIKGFTEDEMRIPLFVNRNYMLPNFADRNSLIFAVSYSGNTEETISAYLQAKKIGAKIIVITSGGKLGDLALKNNNVLVSIPKGYPPRCALGYSLITALVMLSKLGLIKNKRSEIKKTARLLERLRKKKLSPRIKGKANMAKEIARKIHRRFPVVYASARLESVAIRWRGEFAENSKTLASSHVFPEMNHNEIVGWMNPRGTLNKFTAIILKDKGDHPRIKQRMRVTASILKKENFRLLEIASYGNTLLERMLSLIYIGDFVSFYLALLNRIDPTPVNRITYLKKQLAK